MQCNAMLCYAMLCYAMLCYAMLCYAMLCYAMLYVFCVVFKCRCIHCHGVYPSVGRAFRPFVQCNKDTLAKCTDNKSRQQVCKLMWPFIKIHGFEICGESMTEYFSDQEETCPVSRTAGTPDCRAYCSTSLRRPGLWIFSHPRKLPALTNQPSMTLRVSLAAQILAFMLRTKAQLQHATGLNNHQNLQTNFLIQLF